MAGSAGSPPRLTVYVCECGKLEPETPPFGAESCSDFDHEEAHAVEYVLREYPDALGDAVDRFLQGRPTRLRAALNSYREATSE